jgi:EmrB/QacA subfamily drug resistance transporter
VQPRPFPSRITAPSPAEDEPPEGAYKWSVMLVAGSGIYMVTLDSGIVNVALPVLTAEFHTALNTAQWVILGYLLCITALLLPAGRLADMLGRKRVFLVGFLLFAGSSALCGLAPSIGWLVAARVLQGIGGALVQANSPALVTQAFPSSERGRALGIVSAIVSVGLLSGPMVGGLITQYLGWRWAFYVNVPISIVATAVGTRLLRPSPRQPDQRFDLAGAVLFLMAVVALLLTLTTGPSRGWQSAETVALAALALVGAVAFLQVERRVPQPMLDLSLFANQGFRAAAAAAFLNFLALAQVILLMPFYLQRVLELPVSQAGVIMAAIPATNMFVAPFSGTLSDRLGSRMIASLGMLVECVGFLSLLTLRRNEPAALVAARLVLLGFGLGLFNSPNSSALFGSVPRSRLGVVGGMQALTRNLGQSLGQAIAGALWTAVLGALAGSSVATAVAAGNAAALGQAVPAAMTAFRVNFGLSLVLGSAALCISLLGRPSEESRRPDQDQARRKVVVATQATEEV